MLKSQPSGPVLVKLGGSDRKPRLVKAKYRPTQLIDLSERQPIVIPRSLRNPGWRMVQIFLELTRWLLGDLGLRLIRRRTPAVAGVRLRKSLEKLGFMWVKLGQLLSIREDLFHSDFCRELAKLQYQAIGFPVADAKKEMRRALREPGETGDPIERVFDRFQDEPIAAASICQVHKARLREEQVWVAVKVQRPYVAQMFVRDVRFIKMAAGFVAFLGWGGYMRLDELLWELQEVMREETDYRYEVSNLRKLRKLIRDQQSIFVPKAFRKYSSQRLLVMEYIDGVLMSDFLSVAKMKDGEARLQRWQEENNVSPKKAGRRLFLTFFHQLMELNFFHGDLHPGNVLLLRDSRIALIDLGTVGSLEKETLRRYKLMIESLSTGEHAKAADLTLMMCPDLPRTDIHRVREEIIRCFRAWDQRASLDMPYAEKSFGSMGTELSAVMMKHRTVGSWAFLKIGRTWATLDASMAGLYPNADYRKLFAGYFKESMKRRSKSMLVQLAGLNNSLDQIAELRDMGLANMRRKSLLIRSGLSKFERFLGFVLHGLQIAGIIAVGFLIWNFDALTGHHWIEDLTTEMSHHLILTFIIGLLIVGLWLVTRLKNLVSIDDPPDF